VSDSAIQDVASSGFGFVHSDLAAVSSMAASLAFERTANFTITDDSLRDAAKRVRPSAIRDFDVSIPKVRWDDIGGSDEAKVVLPW